MQAVERRRTAFVEATGLGRSRKLDQKQKGDGIVRRPEAQITRSIPIRVLIHLHNLPVIENQGV